ncbi:GGDEF domain-containing protein [Marinobacter fuscus]|uniref:GGDEF domain-containing protein n=1 Tax=Marinobacter fuscus TaxID=2109942 RepID=A0A2T1KXC1_9GAMM|nr:diguanylate cyclase [Marinobacter fuscus]PSF14372.1 GGDEF domain-containing protein [Marinobacter fuscus]
MDIFEQKRRIISIAIVAVVLTGIIIAAAVSSPLINQIHSEAAKSASQIADAKSNNIRTLFSQYQNLANQTASRSELASALAEYARGTMSAHALRQISTPRLADATAEIAPLAALVRFDVAGNELIRIGADSDALPTDLVLPHEGDIANYPFDRAQLSVPLLQAIAPITHQGYLVGHDLLLFHLTAFEHTLSTGSGSQVCLFDDTYDRLLTRLPNGGLELTSQNSCRSELTNMSQVTDTGFFRTTLADGSRVLGFHRSIDGYPWNLFMHAKITSVFGNVIEDVGITIVLILLLSALAGFLVWKSLNPIVHALVAQASRIARSSEELRLAQQVFAHTHEAIVICDTDLGIVRANPAFSDITGMLPKSMDNLSILKFIKTEQGDSFSVDSIRRHLMAENAWQGEVWLKVQPDASTPTLLTVSPVKNQSGLNHQFILTFSDISARVQAEKQMFRLAHFDKLTGLPNRTALENHLEQAIQQARRQHHHFAVMFLDLDKFKPVNDTYGHQAGDGLLQHVARRLKHCVRSDDVVGRRGGDEFLVITGPLERDEHVEAIAGKIISVLNEPFDIQGHRVSIGASVGIALYPDNGQVAEELLEAADKAMYSVKSSGRNHFALA